ncbi:MAG: efflux RND transporter periplasmic adaptor subunit, partial [Bacteroidota bacterium]
NLTVSANGVVQPINRIEVKSKASGQIEQLNVEEGEYVSKGALLIALDQKTAQNDYEQAHADLALAEANALQQENNYKRAIELFGKALISQQERDQINVENVRAKSQLLKGRAALATMQERLQDTRIIAPSSGIVLSKNVEVGQIISSGVSNVGGGTVLATIADMEQVHVETNVDEVDIGKVREGQRARVVADAYPDDGFNGEVIRISPLGKSQQNVTTFSVVVLVRNLSGKLKAGMSCAVDIEIFRRQQVVLVPNEALKDPRSEQGQAMLASLRREATPPAEVKQDSVKSDGSAVAEDQPFDFRALREKTQNMSPDERRKYFQDQMAKMTPEQRERINGMRQRAGGGQGGGFTMGGGGGTAAGPRSRRASQVSNENELRERVVMVKEGNEFVARVIKVGPSNFDYSEVLEGLKEGEELQIVTISRAKLAAEQMTERMRNMNSMGGLGGGNVRGGGR